LLFDFESIKSQINCEKHGIDFNEAKILWTDEDRLEIPAKPMDEPRYLVIGKIGGKYWSAVITYNGTSFLADLDIARARRPGSRAIQIIRHLPWPTSLSIG
jgi:uncharacterized DUF497 family protein